MDVVAGIITIIIAMSFTLGYACGTMHRGRFA